MREYLNILGDFIKDYGSFLVSLGTFFVAFWALKTWKKKMRFEYASKTLFLVNSFYYETCPYLPVDDNGNYNSQYINDLTKQATLIQFIYPDISQEMIELRDMVTHSMWFRDTIFKNREYYEKNKSNNMALQQMRQDEPKLQALSGEVEKLHEKITTGLKSDIEVIKK